MIHHHSIVALSVFFGMTLAQDGSSVCAELIGPDQPFVSPKSGLNLCVLLGPFTTRMECMEKRLGTSATNTSGQLETRYIRPDMHPVTNLLQLTSKCGELCPEWPVVRTDAVLSSGPLFFEDINAKNTDRHIIFDLFTNRPSITTTTTSTPTTTVGVQTTTMRSIFINAAATCGKEPDYTQCWSNDDVDRTIHACCTKMYSRIRNWFCCRQITGVL
jgi:hypothetical protein